MSKTRKKLITIPRLIILALVLMLLLMGAWIGLRSLLVKGLITGIEDMESQGYEVSHGGLSVAGFPFSLNASTDKISVRAPTSDMPDPAKNWSITTDKLDLHSATLTPLSWDIRHTGKMRIDMRGPDGERYMFDLTPASINANAAVSLSGSLKSAQFDMGTASLESLVGTPPIVSKIGDLNADIKVSDNVGHIKVQAKDLRLSPKIPGILDSVLGRKIPLVEMNVDVDNWALLEIEGAEAWMAAGGRMRTDHWAVNWGRADIIGDFNIVFKDGIPEGKIGIRIKKPKPLLAKAVEAGLVPENYLKTVNGLISLSETDAEGRKSIDLTIKEGVVKMGFIPLFEL